jgi:hypothetical protein
MKVEDEVLEHMHQCYLAVAKGGNKVEYENKDFNVKAYRVGEIIRIDIKTKTKN